MKKRENFSPKHEMLFANIGLMGSTRDHIAVIVTYQPRLIQRNVCGSRDHCLIRQIAPSDTTAFILSVRIRNAYRSCQVAAKSQSVIGGSYKWGYPLIPFNYMNSLPKIQANDQSSRQICTSIILEIRYVPPAHSCIKTHESSGNYRRVM